jgi:uncharacterized protein YjdB
MKKFNKILCAFFIFSMLIALIPTTTTQAATKLKLNKTKVTLCVGQTAKLKLTNSSSSVTWKSSNKKTATVSKSGKVTGKKVGTCTITAKVGKKSVKCKVTVAKHNWIKVDETGHYEQVKTGTRRYITDGAGHGPFYSNEEWQEHRATGCHAGYGAYSEDVYETQWVVDTEAYYKCSRCESTK